jgi:glycosyltransferase involved in cell wall biosynthesis
MRVNNSIRIGMVLDKKLPDTRVENEAAILGQAGLDVTLLALDFGGGKRRYENREGYKVYWLPFNKWIVNKLRPFSGTIFDIYSLLWWAIIHRFIKDAEIDILHLNDLYMGLPVLGKKFPFTVDLHENYPATVVSYNWSHKFPLNLILKKSIWKKQEKRILSEASGIISLSQDYADLLADEYKEVNLRDKFCVYPNVPDLSYLEKLRSDKKIYQSEGRITLFYYGVVAERRGIFECFDAMRKLKPEISNLHLLIVGPLDNADRKRFEDEVNEFKEMITYIPWIEFSDFASLVKEVDICLSPIKKNEHHESGIANKVFQYMYFRKPMIVSNCLPQQRVVENYNCGYVYKSGDHNDLARVITQANSEQDRFADMGDRAHKAVEDEFNTQIMGKNLAEFYSKFKC